MSGPSPAAVFDAERPRLVGLAYRMLGSVADAEDVVQEAWLRWAAVDPATIESPPAWLTTVVSRLSLDQLRRRRREQERYVGPWLPSRWSSRRRPSRARRRAPSSPTR
ncbi:MAG: sigma factor [Acidimicrobiales bacterium]